jgi:hypothetical protein
MSTCRDVAEQLAEFAAGSLPPEASAALGRHLDGCPSCRGYLGSYRLTAHLGREVPLPALPRRLARHLRAVLEETRGE